MIRVENVSRHFHQGQTVVRALDGVDLEVARGEFVAVMGPSGSGKSTLLYLLAGLDTPTSGEIMIDDRPLSRLSDNEITLLRRRRLGFVFQFFNLLPGLTAEENVAMPLLLDGKKMRDVLPKAADLLQRVGLGARRTHRPGELSGGEMQRVAIARALVTDPILVLADEPTGNLDSQSGAEVLALMTNLCRGGGQTVILVTHDSRVAARGDRIITFKDGRIAGEQRQVPAA